MTDEERTAYQAFYDEALSAPMDYVVHDTNASYDDALREAAADGGWAFYGMWWRVSLSCSPPRRGTATT